MKVITVKQPYASLIVDGVKDIENRTWKCPEGYVGKRILIHAGLKPANIKYEMEGQATSKEILMFSALNRAEEENLFGYIIGSVQIVDCVINHPSVWAERFIDGHIFVCKTNNKVIWNWVLANPIKFDKPIYCKGHLRFFEYKLNT
jgi:hypothetical protein